MDTCLDIRDTELVIPGMSGRVTLFHVSDNHLCVVDDLTPESEAEHLRTRERFWQDGKKGFCAFFGEACSEDKRGMTTADAFLRLMDHAEQSHADAVLSTGDLMEQMHGAGERFLKSVLAERSFPFMAAPGNHESEACDGLWTTGPQVMEYDDFRVVALDDRQRTVKDAELDAFEALCREGKPIILMMHVPLLTNLNRDSVLGRMETYYYVDEDTCDASGRRLIALLRQYDTVKCILCGHIHGFTRTEPVEGIVQITAPQGMVCGAHRLTVHG